MNKRGDFLKIKKKMEPLHKAAIMIILLILTNSFMLCCDGEKNSDSTSESENIPVYIGSLSDYEIVCPENASGAVNSACLKIRSAVKEASGIQLNYKDDFYKEGNDDFYIGEKEILVGETNRTESTSAYKSLGIFEYIIEVCGSKIVIAAGGDAALEKAADKFIEDFIEKGKLMIPQNYKFEYISEKDGNAENIVPVMKFTFDEVNERKTYSADGKYEMRLINAEDAGGYIGSAARFTRVSKGGGQLENAAVVNLLDGKSEYSVAMWIMPYQSYHGATYYRLFSAYGDSSSEIISISYSSPAIQVSVCSEDEKDNVTLTFPYQLETVIPPFDAVNTNDGVWQLVLLTVDLENNSVKLYINGDEVSPSETVKIDFSAKTVTGTDYAKYTDLVGGDGKSAQNSFNGIIDEFQVFDRALDAEEAKLFYSSYGKAESPSISEDQAFITEMLEKLGGGAAALAGSANAVLDGYVVKADTEDYSIKNVLVDGELCVPYSLAVRIFGEDVKASEKIKDGYKFYSLKELCTVSGRGYIDKLSENGLFIVLTEKSTLRAEDDEKYFSRLAEFCTVTDYEPTNNVEQSRVPITYIDSSEKLFAYSPSITKIGDTLYASCDVSCYYTLVFRSEDGGETWTQMGKIDGLWWATIFAHREELYLVGRYTSGGYYGATGANYFAVTKSTDGGATWTEITAEQGGVSYEGYAVHRAPTPVTEIDGTLYTVFEVHSDSSGARREVVAYADAGSDLLNPASWSFKNYLSDRRFPNEGNAVEGKDGNLWVVSRVAINQGLLSKLSEDGSTLVPYTGSLSGSYIELPGGQSKMTVRYDKTTGKYLAIANIISGDKNCIYQRNYSALISSDDLINWEISELLLCDRTVMNYYLSVSTHAFQYVDWIFDGDDILFVVREAMEDAANFHDSNYMTFYRIDDYRQYLNGSYS